MLYSSREGGHTPHRHGGATFKVAAKTYPRCHCHFLFKTAISLYFSSLRFLQSRYGRQGQGHYILPL